MLIHRYATSKVIETTGEPLHDIISYLDFLTAKDFVVQLLHTKHGVRKVDATQRFSKISPHMKTAIAYIDQAMSGPTDVAFLPAYYAILNLIKVYILFSSHHNLLPQNRFHGATYDVLAKDSHNLATECVTLRKGGAIPLFYEVITGQKYSDKTKIKISEFYPYLVDVSSEWQMVTGQPLALAKLDFVLDKVKGGGRKPIAIVDPLDKRRAPIHTKQLKVLKGFRCVGESNKYKGRTDAISRISSDTLLRKQIEPFLLYHVSEEYLLTPISGRSLLLPEELPIILTFFHMGSVVRYKPEFLARIRDSQYWPVVAQARVHALHKFLLLFWCFTQQDNLFLFRVNKGKNIIDTSEQAAALNRLRLRFLGAPLAAGVFGRCAVSRCLSLCSKIKSVNNRTGGVYEWPQTLDNATLLPPHACLRGVSTCRMGDHGNALSLGVFTSAPGNPPRSPHGNGCYHSFPFTCSRNIHWFLYRFANHKPHLPTGGNV